MGFNLGFKGLTTSSKTGSFACRCENVTWESEYLFFWYYRNSCVLFPRKNVSLNWYNALCYWELQTWERSISIVKPTRCTISQIYFILEQKSTYFGGLSVHHQESKTVQVLLLLASKQPQNLYDIYLMLYVQF